MADEEAFFVVVGVDEPAGDAVGTIAAHLASIGVEDIHAVDFDGNLACGGFDPSLPLEDLDCWLRLSARHAIARLPEVLACYRKHPNNSLRQRRKMLGAFFLTHAKFLENHPGLIPDADIRRHFRWYLERFRRRYRDDPTHALLLFAKYWLSSHYRTPLAVDYRRLGDMLLNPA